MTMRKRVTKVAAMRTTSRRRTPIACAARHAPTASSTTASLGSATTAQPSAMPRHTPASVRVEAVSRRLATAANAPPGRDLALLPTPGARTGTRCMALAAGDGRHGVQVRWGGGRFGGLDQQALVLGADVLPGV